MQHMIVRAYLPGAGGDPPIGAGGAPWSIQPHSTYVRRMLPPATIRSNPASGVCTQASDRLSFAHVVVFRQLPWFNCRVCPSTVYVFVCVCFILFREGMG